MESLDISVLDEYSAFDGQPAWDALFRERTGFDRKIVVLDDDPTGVQTIHDISVYTDWSYESMLQGFTETNCMFFVLTNSRSFTSEETLRAHREIAQNLHRAADRSKQDFIIISRSDSTLRGHYPLETLTLKEELEGQTGRRFSGEIIVPFFKEGGRYTLDNIHYVKEGTRLVPVAMTDYAMDRTFGFKSSHLGQWCEEKTAGAYRADDMTYISLECLRIKDYETIERQLLAVENFNKVIVNAIDYSDIAVFSTALIRSIKKGKEFMIRGAAAVTKVLGGVPDKPLLAREDLVSCDSGHGGVILVGSHVSKTTQQLEMLQQSGLPVEFIAFNQHLVLEEGQIEKEICRVVSLMEASIQTGRSVVVYTRRERIDLACDDKHQQLLLSVRISDALTSVIKKLSVRPGFILAKGGITASDVGTKALAVRHAVVMGQVKPGIPVWRIDEGSKYPGMPFIIFPGNVGETSTLCEIVEMLVN